ncbi:MAG TPA: class I SAM-dependent methyltransferase [Gemmatimonadaceae bacterium]|nr:class I SAM-dependent methyltransferase [Gemmatimonadaceae bacterium]
MLSLEGARRPANPGAARRAVGFIRPYLVALGGALYLFTIGWLRPRHRAALVDLSGHFGYRYDARISGDLPRITSADVAPDAPAIEIREIEAADGNVTEGELVTICAMTRSLQPAGIFEFGTFDGRTTLNLALNSPDEARVYTIDLPAMAIGSTTASIHPHEVQFADKAQSGRRFRGTPFEKKITQLYGDSGAFDFSPYYDSIDMVFVDASHTYEHVINDSLHALRMLRCGHGLIVWHDYSRWDGVTGALNDLHRLHPSFKDLRWVAGMTLAILRI